RRKAHESVKEERYNEQRDQAINRARAAQETPRVTTGGQEGGGFSVVPSGAGDGGRRGDNGGVPKVGGAGQSEPAVDSQSGLLEHLIESEDYVSLPDDLKNDAFISASNSQIAKKVPPKKYQA